MSLIIINILAYFAILALLAFFAVVAWAAFTIMHMVNEAKGAAGVIDPPKRAIMSIIATGKGIARRLAQRGRVIGAQGTRVAGSVVGVKDDIVTVYQSIDVEGAKDSAQEAADSVRHSRGADATILLKQVLDTLQDAQRAQKSQA